MKFLLFMLLFFLNSRCSVSNTMNAKERNNNNINSEIIQKIPLPENNDDHIDIYSEKKEDILSNFSFLVDMEENKIDDTVDQYINEQILNGTFISNMVDEEYILESDEDIESDEDTKNESEKKKTFREILKDIFRDIKKDIKNILSNTSDEEDDDQKELDQGTKSIMENFFLAKDASEQNTFNQGGNLGSARDCNKSVKESWKSVRRSVRRARTSIRRMGSRRFRSYHPRSSQPKHQFAPHLYRSKSDPVLPMNRGSQNSVMRNGSISSFDVNHQGSTTISRSHSAPTISKTGSTENVSGNQVNSTSVSRSKSEPALVNGGSRKGGSVNTVTANNGSSTATKSISNPVLAKQGNSPNISLGSQSDISKVNISSVNKPVQNSTGYGFVPVYNNVNPDEHLASSAATAISKSAAVSGGGVAGNTLSSSSLGSAGVSSTIVEETFTIVEEADNVLNNSSAPPRDIRPPTQLKLPSTGLEYQANIVSLSGTLSAVATGIFSGVGVLMVDDLIQYHENDQNKNINKYLPELKHQNYNHKNVLSNDFENNKEINTKLSKDKKNMDLISQKEEIIFIDKKDLFHTPYINTSEESKEEEDKIISFSEDIEEFNIEIIHLSDDENFKENRSDPIEVSLVKENINSIVSDKTVEDIYISENENILDSKNQEKSSTKNNGFERDNIILDNTMTIINDDLLYTKVDQKNIIESSNSKYKQGSKKDNYKIKIDQKEPNNTSSDDNIKKIVKNKTTIVESNNTQINKDKDSDQNIILKCVENIRKKYQNFLKYNILKIEQNDELYDCDSVLLNNTEIAIEYLK